jgi:hypothetical protein
MKVVVLLTINFDKKVVNFFVSKLHGHVYRSVALRETTKGITFLLHERLLIGRACQARTTLVAMIMSGYVQTLN